MDQSWTIGQEEMEDDGIGLVPAPNYMNGLRYEKGATSWGIDG